MRTGGRIRLFWGVSPDFMALALSQDYTCFYFTCCPFCAIHAKRTAGEIKVNGFGTHII